VYKHTEVSRQIIKAFYDVYNTLGYGFLEAVYERALTIEFGKLGLHVVPQARIQVNYAGQVVGEYFADLVVEEKVLVEVKAAHHLGEEHEAQLLNYLKATRYEVGLLLNFGPKPQLKRKAYENARKGTLEWAE